MKGGSEHEIDEIDDEYLDGFLHNTNLETDLAMQIISEGKTVRSKTVQDLKAFNSQSLATEVKKGEQLVSMMPAIKKTFDLVGDTAELSQKTNL